MDTNQALLAAEQHLLNLGGHIFDVLAVHKPMSPQAAVFLAKVVSKLSPLVGNLIEFNTVELLNEQPEFSVHGKWMRQDPGFPDTIFQGNVTPVPGFEIKAWFPLATEMTARFKDSQNHFVDNNTWVAIIAWLPEYLISGKPQILGVCVASGQSIAYARDTHYHKPPSYIVLEPEDTKQRTRNLQQTNTAGYILQETGAKLQDAIDLVKSWGSEHTMYKPTPEYQSMLRQLTSRFTYRLDTNYSKMDRIGHAEVEHFISRIYNLKLHGMTVNQWRKILGKKVNPKGKGDHQIRAETKQIDAAIQKALSTHLKIREADAQDLLE